MESDRVHNFSNYEHAVNRQRFMYYVILLTHRTQLGPLRVSLQVGGGFSYVSQKPYTPTVCL